MTNGQSSILCGLDLVTEMSSMRDTFSYFKYNVAFSFGLMYRESLNPFPMFAFLKKTDLCLVLVWGVSTGC